MEADTDHWVATMLDELGIRYASQGSDIPLIKQALSTASKKGTGNNGKPEFTAVVEGFALVFEDKPSVSRHKRVTGSGVLDMSVKAVEEYAVNGAVFYGKHVAQGSPFKKVFAIGISGSERAHHISPYYVDDRGEYKCLPDLESLHSLSPKNIQEYYSHEVLGEETDEEKTTKEILDDAARLHEYMRSYGALKDQDKPLVVSGILLALDEVGSGGFSIDSLRGDDINTDGDKIYAAIQNRLKRSGVGPDAKCDKLMSEFSIIRTSTRLNKHNPTLGMTPLRLYTEFIFEHVFRSIKYQSSSEDFIGRFYGEFMSYSGGDGQTLGIVLTPKHICDLFCDLLKVQPEDIVLDPCCGTAGFLIAAMHRMLAQEDDAARRKDIKRAHLHGFELQSNMFAIACTNMILRKDGNSNLQCLDFLKQNPAETQLKGATIGMMNPPYSQGSRNNPDQYEISFVEHLLDSLTEGARAAVIVPKSTMVGGRIEERITKARIMKRHTLEGAITCNPNTFGNGRVGTEPVIAVFTAHEPHPKGKVCRFIDFSEDGYDVRMHVGLVEGTSAKGRRARMLDVWRGISKAPNSFCVDARVTPPSPPYDDGHAGDEWLHAFYYFNDAPPSEKDFERVVEDYLTFEFSMFVTGHAMREPLPDIEQRRIPTLEEKEWKPFCIGKVFERFVAGQGRGLNHLDEIDTGGIPYVGATNKNNGVRCFVSDNEKCEGMVQPGRCVGFIKNGNGAAGYAIYMHESFVSTPDVIYGYSDNLDGLVGLFLVAAQNVIEKKYSHGYKRTLERLVHDRIMLPANIEGNPDYDYMRQYIANIAGRKREQYRMYLCVT